MFDVFCNSIYTGARIVETSNNKSTEWFTLRPDSYTVHSKTTSQILILLPNMSELRLTNFILRLSKLIAVHLINRVKERKTDDTSIKN